jgi:hypothetical protein
MMPIASTAQTSERFSWKSAWRQHTTAGSNTEAFGGPLVDQNGNWARFQMRVNHEEFDYIRDNGLYSVDKQIDFSQKPKDNQVDLPLNEGTTKHGAIEIKLAWKELLPGEDDSRFFVKQVTAEISEVPGTGPKTRPFKAGLVGMHIAMRTQSSPEWIWATFEQIDNVPDPDRPLFHPTFNNPNDKSTPPNVLPIANAVQDPDTGVYSLAKPPAADKWVENLTKTPVQLTRVQVITQPGLNPHDADLDAVAKEVTQQMQKLLKDRNSVFQYYKLIDVQWPVQPNAPAAAGGAGSAPESVTYKTPGQMVPVFLVNTTMETYFQHGSQPAGALEQDDRLAAGSPPIDSTKVEGTESCVGCHYSSGIATGYKKDTKTGKIVVDKNGIPSIVTGENNHFGRTGNASFSWMLQLEPRVKRRDIHDPGVIVPPPPPPSPNPGSPPAK